MAQKVLYLLVKMDLAAILIGRGRGMDQFSQEEVVDQSASIKTMDDQFLCPFLFRAYISNLYFNFYKQLHMVLYIRNVSDLSA